jgi:iron complex transport system ATP-binding protein
MEKNALSFRDVSAGYKHRKVLDHVSFTVREGEFVSLIGPNGCGKSTLLKTAAALLKPLSGVVELFDQDVHLLKPENRIPHGLYRQPDCHEWPDQLDRSMGHSLSP